DRPTYVVRRRMNRAREIGAEVDVFDLAVVEVGVRVVQPENHAVLVDLHRAAVNVEIRADDVRVENRSRRGDPAEGHPGNAPGSVIGTTDGHPPTVGVPE